MYPGIRMFTVPQWSRPRRPWTIADAAWQTATRARLRHGQFSASVGYFFGRRRFTKALGIPVRAHHLQLGRGGVVGLSQYPIIRIHLQHPHRLGSIQKEVWR